MTLTIKHNHQTALPNDPSKDISADAWNDSHSVTGTPDAGGSNGQIQFNNSGPLAGDANLFWDETHKYLGLGTNTPAGYIDSHALDGSIYPAWRFTGTTFPALEINAENASGYTTELHFSWFGAPQFELGTDYNSDKTRNWWIYDAVAALQRFILDPDGTATFGTTANPTRLNATGSLGIIEPGTAPSSPASGWVFYVDSGDSNKLKAKSSSGTVVSFQDVRPALEANATFNVPSQYSTIQAALNAAAMIDFNGFTLTIQLANGTYSENVVVPVTVGQGLPSNLILQGDTGTPTNVVLSSPSGFAPSVLCGAGARCRIQGVQFTGTTNAHGIEADTDGVIEFVSVDFGANLFFQCFANGGVIKPVGNYSISAGAFSHWAAEGLGKFQANGFGTVTLTGTPAFSSFANCSTVSYMRVDSNTFSGSATGSRYSVQNNAVIDSKGSGATYLPGDSAGATASGGIYL